jgi:hypothetical protein
LEEAEAMIPCLVLLVVAVVLLAWAVARQADRIETLETTVGIVGRFLDGHQAAIRSLQRRDDPDFPLVDAEVCSPFGEPMEPEEFIAKTVDRVFPPPQIKPCDDVEPSGEYPAAR